MPQLRQHRKPRHDRQRKRPVSAQMIYSALNWKRRSIRQPRHRKSLDGVLLFSKRQKIAQKHLFESHCPSVRLYLIYRPPKIHRACAQRTCAHDRTRRSRKVPPRQQRRNKGGVHICGRQRNPAQKKCLRGMIFIQRNQKFVLQKIFSSANRRASVKSQQSRNCAASSRLNQRQRKHRTFGISSRPTHGRRATQKFPVRAVRNVLFENTQ